MAQNALRKFVKRLARGLGRKSDTGTPTATPPRPKRVEARFHPPTNSIVEHGALAPKKVVRVQPFAPGQPFFVDIHDDETTS